jgi:hypothetical protein
VGDFIGYICETILLVAGLLILAGFIRISKSIPSKHPLNRKVGKGLILLSGSMLITDLLLSASFKWMNFWMQTSFELFFLILTFLGVRVLLAATKDIRMLDQQTKHDPSA